MDQPTFNPIHRRTLAAWLLIAPLLIAPTLQARSAEPEPVAKILAPSGKLRVALYPGTPTSILDPKASEPRGVGFELGKALAARLGVPYEPVIFGRNAEVLEAVTHAKADIAFTNASAERAKVMDFSQPYLEIELGYLVPKGSALTQTSDIDAKGIRVGVTQGSTSDGTLSRDLKLSEIVRSVTLKDGIAMLADGRIDAYATNKASLFEMADQLPGSRVLDGRWGAERHAIGVPKGREPGMALLRAFVDDVKKQGLAKAAASRAGLRGAVVPD